MDEREEETTESENAGFEHENEVQSQNSSIFSIENEKLNEVHDDEECIEVETINDENDEEHDEFVENEGVNVDRVNKDDNVEKGNEGVQDWAMAVKGNRLMANGLGLSYVAPKMLDGQPIAELQKEDVDKEVKKWETTLIVYVIGVKPTLIAMHKFVEFMWNFISKPDIFQNEDGYFLGRCSTRKDRAKVISSGPYFMYSKAVVVKEWVPEFKFEPDMLRLLPIWTKFPKLPLAYWVAENLSRSASSIGKPLYADECTTLQTRISYARVLIEVDITTTLRDSVDILGLNGEKMTQRVEYEWKPKFCMKCNKLGHDCEEKRQIQQNEEIGGNARQKGPHKVWKEKVQSVGVKNTPEKHIDGSEELNKSNKDTEMASKSHNQKTNHVQTETGVRRDNKEKNVESVNEWTDPKHTSRRKSLFVKETVQFGSQTSFEVLSRVNEDGFESRGQRGSMVFEPGEASTKT